MDRASQMDHGHLSSPPSGPNPQPRALRPSQPFSQQSHLLRPSPSCSLATPPLLPASLSTPAVSPAPASPEAATAWVTTRFREEAAMGIPGAGAVPALCFGRGG